MDLLDSAQQTSDFLLNAALREQQAKSQRGGVEFEHCQECGVEIPKARRAAIKNCSTCADCQHLIELKQKHFKR